MASPATPGHHKYKIERTSDWAGKKMPDTIGHSLIYKENVFR